MAFWDHFFSNQESGPQKSNLQQQIEKLLPEESSETHLKIACISGLMARVAYADLEIHPNEAQDMKMALEEHCEFSKNQIDTIVKMAIDDIKELAGLEDHLYSSQLSDILNEKEKFSLLKVLFTIAGSDDTVDNKESEQIRSISKGLRLSNQHFLSARGTVAEKLSSLK